METILSKIAVTETADEALVEALKRVNDGFQGGRVTKTDLASWLISQGSGKLNQEAINEIHQAHFNQVAYLGALVKRLKSAGQNTLGPEEIATLSALLKSQDGLKRKGRRAPNEETVITEAA